MSELKALRSATRDAEVYHARLPAYEAGATRHEREAYARAVAPRTTDRSGPASCGSGSRTFPARFESFEKAAQHEDVRKGGGGGNQAPGDDPASARPRRGPESADARRSSARPVEDGQETG
jgi:hypothetical protein